MKRNKLLTWFATVLMLLCVQSANAFTLTCLRGSDFGKGEGCQKLFDGEQDTKWGTWDGWYGDPVYAVVKAIMPIAPATYSLRIANDTNGHAGRNWKSWRIFGGNFASEADAEYDAEGWVLLDQKTDQKMTTDQFAEVQLELSNPDGKFYSYFMIIVDAICTDPNWDDYTQMDEFWFRDYKADISAAKEYADFDYTTDVDADLKAAYADKLAILNDAVAENNPDKIVPAVEAIAPLYNEINTLRNGGFVALDWTDSWGDAPGSNFVDKDDDTKWGGSFPEEGEHVQYIIFRAPAQQPYFYKLVTGDDTEDWNTRNWQTWKIFGGNFATEAEAARSAEGWVVLDEREGISTDLLPNKNNFPATLNFTKGVSEKYTYYKVEVTASGGDQQQMSEIYLCTQDEFNSIRQSLIDDLADFAAGVANMAVESEVEEAKTTFADKFAQLKNTTDADQLTLLNNELIVLKDSIEYSAAFVGGGYRPLDGNTAWGDGENWTKLIDGDEETKWGGDMPEDGTGSYVIFKVNKATKYSCYKLITGNDTKGNYGRNWASWKIYGCSIRGNKDEDATRETELWNLLDVKTDIKQDQLPAANFATAYFDFSEEAKAYRYFKIEVESAYKGNSIQMSEFKMLTTEEWADVCKEYTDSLERLKVEVLGDMLLVEPVATQVADAIAAVAEAKASTLEAKFAEAREVIINAPKNMWLAKYQLTEKDGVLQIGTAADMFNFAKVINDGTVASETTFIDAVLTADIDLSEAITDENPWIAIGNWGTVNGTNVSYKGHFDGQGHTIKGFNATSTQNYFGIFGVISTGALIENFDVYGTIKTTIQNAGGVAGYARDDNPTIRNIHSFVNINNTYAGGRQGGILGNSNNGTVVVENCWYSGTLDGNDAANNGNYGGIVGYVQNNVKAFVTINNCLFDGKVINTAETPGNCTFGGIVGYNNAGFATITNCLSIGTLQSAVTGQLFGKINGNNSVFANNYYKGETINGKGSGGTVSGDTPVKVTDEQLKSGEVAINLGTAFRQYLGDDEYPVPDATRPIVAKITEAGVATLYIKDTDVVIPEGVNAYAGVIEKAGILHLEPIEGKIAAGEAVVLKGAAGYYGFAPTTEAVKAEKNILIGADEDMQAAGKYILAKPEGKDAGFYLADGGILKAGKAYIVLLQEDAVKALYFAEEDATGIENVNVNDNVNEGAIYNIAGQRVSKLQKGINIVNGKKVLF